MNEIIDFLIEQGIDKETLVALYRGDKFFNQRKIAEVLNNKFNRNDIKQSHITRMLDKYEIPVWTRSDTRHAQNINPVGYEFIEKRVSVLQEAGYTVNDLEKLYKSGKSKNEIIQIVNNQAEKNILNKKVMKQLWSHYNLFTRDDYADNQLRMRKVNDAQKEKLKNEKAYGNGYTAQELVDLYLSGLSLDAVAEKTGSNATTISKLVKNSGNQIRKEINTQRHSAHDMVAEMMKYGIGKNEFKSLLSHNSQIKAVEIINKKVGFSLVNRSALSKIAQHFGFKIEDYQSRTIRSNQEIKTYGPNKLTKEEIIEKYKTEELSLQKMYQKYKISPYTISKILKDEGVEVKKQKNVVDLLKEVEQFGINEESFKERYLAMNCTQKEMIDWFKNLSNVEITSRTLQKIIKIFKAHKDDAQRIEVQGRKSRNDLSVNFEKLRKAGFESREELAQHYEANLSLTKNRLLKQLNEKLGEDFFTVRWLERHLDPFLSEDRLKGVSRVEKEFQELLAFIVPEDATMILNDWKTIAPYQLDVLLPELNIAIEFNGNYWHSDKFLMANHNMTAEEYHTMKTLMCKEKGINLLFVWEYDWYADSDVIIAELEKVFKGKKAPSILTKKVYGQKK